MAVTSSGISKRFGNFVALDNVSPRRPDGRADRAARPERQRQVDPAARHRRPRRRRTSGDVVISGQDTTGVPPQDRGVGFVFQHYAAFKHMTVRDNVGFGLSIRKEPKAEIRQARRRAAPPRPARRARRALPVAALRRRSASGWRLARALAVEPEVLLLDEPFGALDARVRKELRTWLRRLHDDVHVTTVLVTHDQEEAMDVADRIVLMNQGKIEQIGTPRDLYEHPANEFVMAFVGPVNRLGEDWVRPHDLDLLDRAERRHQRGDDRADRPPRLRGARRAGPAGRRARLGAGDARRGRAARAARGPDRVRPPEPDYGVRRGERGGLRRSAAVTWSSLAAATAPPAKRTTRSAPTLARPRRAVVDHDADAGTSGRREHGGADLEQVLPGQSSGLRIVDRGELVGPQHVEIDMKPRRPARQVRAAAMASWADADGPRALTASSLRNTADGLVERGRSVLVDLPTVVRAEHGRAS